MYWITTCDSLRALCCSDYFNYCISLIMPLIIWNWLFISKHTSDRIIKGSEKCNENNKCKYHYYYFIIINVFLLLLSILLAVSQRSPLSAPEVQSLQACEPLERRGQGRGAFATQVVVAAEEMPTIRVMLRTIIMTVITNITSKRESLIIFASF